MLGEWDMDGAPIWITEADVTATMALPDAISALERALAMEAGGAAANLPKTHLMVAANDAMHAIGAAVAGAGICGTKTWVNVGGKSQTVLVLFSLEDGRLRAVVEATALGQMRTAAMTGVGTARLAAEDARRLALIGTGKQALPNAAACAAVRDIEEIHVYSRRAGAREALAARIQDELGIRAAPAASVEAAVADAHIVTAITNATAPFLSARMIAPGAHVNAMGAIVPVRVEFAQDVFARCGVIAVDTIEGVRALSAEFRERFGDDDAAWRAVRPISRLIAEDARRPAGCDLTLFKAVGMGLSDLALGIEVLGRAEAGGLGAPVPKRVRVPPRLR